MAVEDTTVLDTEASLFHFGAKNLGYLCQSGLGSLDLPLAFLVAVDLEVQGRIEDLGGLGLGKTSGLALRLLEVCGHHLQLSHLPLKL